MIDILKGEGIYQRALPSPPSKRYAVEQLRFELEKVIKYRRGLPRKVGGQYLLLRLLQSLDTSITLGDQQYVWAIEDVALRIANSFRMTSLYGHGQPLSGICYGDDVKEVWLAVTDSFDLSEARKQWEELMPIRVMSHPYNDFTLPYLDGTGEGLKGGGWAVLEVNVPMLAFQYKCWWETYVKNAPDSPPGLNLFFNRYPLANLLRSHLDITLLNRTMTMDMEGEIETQTDPNPFYVNFQQAGQSDRMILQALTFMQRTNFSFDDWLDCIPQACAPNVHEWLALPDMPFTTQVEWAYFVARLNVMGWLLAHNAKLDSAYNNLYVVNIRHWVQRMRNGRFFHQGLRGTDFDAIEAIINQTIDPYI